MKIAFIGCGEISEHHAKAFQEAGFEIAAVCSRPGSQRPHEFARRHGVSHVFSDAGAMLRAWAWDALLITVPPQAALPILKDAISLGVPILIEKPVADRSRLIEPLLGRDLPVIVGYNRRFYRPIREIRTIVRQSAQPYIAQLVLPETVFEFDTDNWKAAIYNRFLGNSVHALDMLRFIFGSVDILGSDPLTDDSGRLAGLAASLKAGNNGTIVQLTAVWNSPANISLTLYQRDSCVQLKPFEHAVVYTRVERLEPTPEIPLRRYVPYPEMEVTIDPIDQRFKPGFVQQAMALRQMIDGKMPDEVATLDDAYKAVKLAEDLLDGFV